MASIHNLVRAIAVIQNLARAIASTHKSQVKSNLQHK